MVVRFTCIEGAEKLRPVDVRRAWVDIRACRRCREWCRARRDLVQVFGNTQPVSMHSHVARTNRRAVGDLPLHRDVPLVRLRIAVVWVYALIETATPNLGSHRRWR